ncbi:non-ribosomal peptide synthetase [Micromonospora noduli]|uniref:non-ribosomal peptide synthetase n=2 Tax=Micromonospora noduli TaxID=709876 RepID=UPI000DC51FED|nr:non-ribosomal peptide synthetase [Micromonospora noduli]RAO07923.1 Linear gramicidin synthase subunit B [Micromonospora noduli]
MNQASGYRLSPAQRQQWARTQRHYDRPISARLGLAGPVDRARLRAALDAVTAHHEALRLRLVATRDVRVPVQFVDDDHRVALHERSAPAAPDPMTDPVQVIVSDDELVVAASPLVLDSASITVVLRDIAACYGGVELPHDPDRLQFLDVSEWLLEERDVAPRTGTPSEAAGTRALELPVVTENGAPDAGREHAELRIDVHGAELARLLRTAEAHDGDVETLLLGAWLTALARYVPAEPADGGTSGDALTVAWYDPARSADGTADVVGTLGCWASLALPLPLPASVKQLLAAVTAARAAVAPEMASTDVVEGLVGVLASFATTRLPSATAFEPLPVSGVAIDPPAAFGPIHLQCVLSPEGLELTLHGELPAPRRNSARWLLQSVAEILRTLAVADDDASQQLMGADEADVLRRWAGTPTNETPETLVRLLDRGIAQAAPDTAAVVADDGNLTFRELDAAATAVARHLTALGVRTEDRVMLLAARSRLSVVGLLGVLRAGAVYVPVDPDQPEERIRLLARAVDPRVVLGGPAQGELLARLSHEFITADLEARADDGGIADAVVEPHHGAYIIFTSGSTGEPRPVVVEHRSAAHLYSALRQVVCGSADGPLRVSVNAPLSFDASIKQLIQLAGGHTLCVVPDEVRHDGKALLRFLADNEVDVFDCTPSHVRILLDVLDDSVRWPATLLVGGEAISEDLWQRLAAIDNVRAINLYGPTECAVDVTAAEIVADAAVSIGRPLPGTCVWILDENLRPVPPGVAGELCVSGPQVAREYLGATAATEQRFAMAGVPDGRRVRVYRTGDRARFLPDGTLLYLGRLDDEVKVRGHRVQPAEVAAVLARHPDVDQAVVVARNDETTGEPQLVAYAVAKRGGVAVVDPAKVDGLNPHETRYLYNEIFIQRVYLRGGVVLKPGAVVFDVGANIGMFSLFAHAQCPDVALYAFEPLAPAFNKLESNLTRHGVAAHRFPFGLSAEEKDVAFTYYPGYSMMSGQSSYADPDAEIDVIKRYLANERAQGAAGRDDLLAEAGEVLADRFDGVEHQCRLRRLSDVIDEQGVERIDLLKIDVQRAELDVLRGLDDRHWPLVQQVTMEVHEAPRTPTAGRLAEITRLLESHGFTVAVEQDILLDGTDRHSLYGVRPGYAGRESSMVENSVTISPPPPIAAKPGALRDWLAERLPQYLVPAFVVVLDALPRTPRGKLDRAALPAPHGEQPTVTPAAAENPMEQVLVEVWSELLGRTDVGVEDDFFQVGGDSLRAIRMRAAAARRGVTFPLRQVFRHHTIRALVRHGGASMSASAERQTQPGDSNFRLVRPADRTRLPGDAEDAYPLTALQLGMVYHTEMTGGSSAYHVVTVHEINCGLEPDALAAALAGASAAHPVLRTSFDLGRYSEPLQLVQRSTLIPLSVEDVSGLDEAGRSRRIATVVDEQRAQPFTWATAPLVRIQALRTGPDSSTLVVTHHHAVMDGLSLNLFLDDVLERYDRHRTGITNERRTEPALPFWRHVQLESEARHREESRQYWRQALHGAQPARLAPSAETDASDIPRMTALWVEPLPAGLGKRLGEVAAASGLPLKSLLLATHVRVQAEATGRADLLTGLVVNCRPAETGGDKTLGLFLNTLPVRLTVGPDSLLSLAERAWRAEQDLMGHHLVPLTEVALLAGQGTLFDVFFNYTRFDGARGAAITHRRGQEDRPVDVAFTLAVDCAIDPQDDSLHLELQYDARWLSGYRVQSLAARYRELLEGLVRAPEQPLPDLAASPAVDGGGPVWADRLSDLWQETTGTAPSGDADFFTSGGSSLSALRLTAILRDRHGVTVDLAEIHRNARFDTLVALVMAEASRQRVN